MSEKSVSKSPNVSVEISGGFGNQLFQLAAAQFLRIQGQSVYLDVTINQKNGARANLISGLAAMLELPIRELNCWQKVIWNMPFVRRVIQWPNNSFVIKEEVEFQLPPVTSDRESVIYRGYWQNSIVASTIRDEASKFFQLTQNPPIARIALHVRRGDYLQGGNPNFHGVLTGDYYVAAINSVRNIVGSLPVLVFTDSPDLVSKETWVSEITNLSIAESIGTIEDFIGIANSSAIICSNSTYSWWAAYLSESEIIILPSKWQVGLDIPNGLLQDRTTVVNASFVGQD